MSKIIRPITWGFYFIFTLLLAVPASQATETITPSHVFAQAERVQADILAIKAHFNIITPTPPIHIKTTMRPRHVWQKTAEILAKINIYYRAIDYPVITSSSLEAISDLPPQLVYDQTQRILLELRLIKERLDITTPTPAARHHQGKTPSDVYRILSRASIEMDTINGKSFTPSNVFSQVFRLNADIDMILDAIGIHDISIPPAKRDNSKPADVFKAGMALKRTINIIQDELSITITDFTGLNKAHILPSDVFELIGLINAELQEIKNTLSLRNQPTPPGNVYSAKIPADVEQLIGWCNHKLKQVVVMLRSQ